MKINQNNMRQNHIVLEKINRKLFLILLLGLSSFTALSQVIYTNGPVSTGVIHEATNTTAPVGYTWSELQAPGLNIGFSGFYNNTSTSDYAIADDFVVPAGKVWNLTNVNFYGYQTNYSGTNSPIDAVRVRIWNGDPSSGNATVVYGNMTTNVYNASGSGEEFVYRVTSETGTTRRIWRLSTNVFTSLPSGTYWVEFQVHATNDMSAFIPPVTILDAPSNPSWNAKQRSEVTWSELIDGGSTFNKALPFQIIGSVTLGLDSNSLTSNFTMYPMPVKDVCNFKLKQNTSLKPKSVSIYDLNGRLMQQDRVDDEVEFSVSTVGLPTGVYLLQILDDNDKVVFSDKLIKG